MAIIEFENGMRVEFDGTPTEADIEEVFSSIQKKDIPLAPIKEKPDLLSRAAGVGEKILGVTGGKNIAEIGGSLLSGQSLPQALRTQGGGSLGKGIAKTAGDVGAITATVAPLGTPIAKTVLGKAAQFGGLSAMGAGAKTVADNGTAKEAAKNAFMAGLTGAAIGGAVGLAGKAVKAFTTKTPEATYNNVLRVTNRIKMAGKSPSDFLVKEGVWGDLGTFKKAAEEGITKENVIIKTAVKNAQGVGRYSEVKSLATKELSQSLGKLLSKSEISTLVDDVPLNSLRNAPQGELRWDIFNDVRSQLGRYIGDTKWTATAPSEKVAATKAVYRAMADLLKKASGTDIPFARESQWIRTNKAVENAIRVADGKYGLGLYDSIFGTAGAITGAVSGEGSATERLKRAAIGGVTGVAIERGVRSPTLQTGFAQIVSKLNSIPTDTAGKVSKTAVINLINQMFRK